MERRDPPRFREGHTSLAATIQAVRLSAAVALAVAFTLGSLPVVAQEAPEPPPAPAQSAGASVPAARFVIERIVVEGVRHGSQKIVAAETLLVLGGSYTEAQLQQALHRVERLPFVVQADFSLRKGSARGRYELVVAVTETMPIFFGGSLDLVCVDSSYNSRSPGSDFYSSDRQRSGTGRPEVGGRVFFGDHSEVSAAVDGVLVTYTRPPRDLGYSLAYTHHNLFGRHIVGSVSLGSPLGVTSTTFIASAQVAFPMSRADVLQLSGQLRVDKTFWNHRSLFDIPSTFGTEEVSWQHDTTDDPFFPRRGTRSEVGIEYSTRPIPGPEEHLLTGSLGASRYWPLGRRVSVGVSGNVTRSDIVRGIAADGWYAAAGVAARLLGSIPWGRGGATRYWWEIGAESSYVRTRRVLDEDVPGQSYSEWSTIGGLSASISGRGRWGTVRLTFRYRHVDSQYREP